MDESPFGKLAAELRNRIYEFVLIDHEYNIGIYANSPLRKKNPGAISDRLSLTATCRKIRREALPIFYCSNGFLICGWDFIEPNDSEAFEERPRVISHLEQWVSSLGASSRHLQSVRVKLSEWVACWYDEGYAKRDIPEYLKGLQNALSETEAELEVCLPLRWALVFDCDSTVVDVRMIPSDLPGCRKKIEAALQDEGSLVESTKKEMGDSWWDRLETHLKRELDISRHYMGLFMATLEANDLKA